MSFWDFANNHEYATCFLAVVLLFAIDSVVTSAAQAIIHSSDRRSVLRCLLQRQEAPDDLDTK